MVSISYMAGTIVKEEMMKFKRMVFRATRGKALTYFEDLSHEGQIDYAGYTDKQLRTVYVIIFQEGGTIRTQLKKICESFMGRQVEIPIAFGNKEIKDRIRDLERRILDTKSLLIASRLRFKDYLKGIQKIIDRPDLEDDRDHDRAILAISVLEIYKMFIVKEKALYATLNKFKVEGGLYIGFGWIPKIDNQAIMRQIEGMKERNRNIETPQMKVIHEHGVKPPSLFRNNDVTWVFQEIVNTYGIPNYKEVNPTIFTIVTFPFLFGIMFGDIGHGLVLFLIGALLCLFEDVIRTKAPSMEGVLVLRYIALLMGIFATFCGLIYNDFMAIPLWIWDSCYDLVEIPHTPAKAGEHERTPYKSYFKQDCVYPVGIDPAWHLGSNELTYLNSLKMKLSVILGVLQMGLGVCMKAFNASYFGNKLDFMFEFLPQIILLLALFGWMDVLIIAKWLTDFTHREYEAPAIISTMIDMFLNGAAIPPGVQAIVGSAST